MATYDESLTLSGTSAQANLETSQCSVAFSGIASQLNLETSQCSLIVAGTATFSPVVSSSISVSLSMNSTANFVRFAQLNPVLWAVGETIYLDNQITMGAGRKFNFNYVPDDIVSIIRNS